MECVEFRPQYAEVIRGVRSGSLAEQAESHLAECAACQGWVREEQEIRNLLRNRLPYYKAPASLRVEIQASRERGRWNLWPQTAAAALATALAMLLLFLPTLPHRIQGDALQSFLPAVIDQHIRFLLWGKPSPAEAEVVDAIVQLGSELGIKSSMFFTGDEDARLITAQPTYLRNLMGVALVYEEPEGHMVTYFLMRNGQGRFKLPDTGRVQIDRYRPYLVRTDGFALLTWRFGEWSLFLISDTVSDYDLLKLEKLFLKVRTAAESTLY